MRCIRILDNEEKYAASLGAYLESHLTDCKVLIGEPSTKVSDDSAGMQAEVVVAGNGYRNWAADSRQIPVLRLAPLLYRENPDTLGTMANEQGPARLGNARDIAEAIERLVPSRKSQDSTGWMKPRTSSRIAALLTDACDLARKSYVEKLLSLSMDAGGRAVYFPFLPAYRMACTPMSAGGGPTLTQLLLSATQEDPDRDALGSYLHPARSGVLCMRPAESHEHLLQCPPDCLRHVMRTLVRWMDIQPEHSIAVADLAELPEDTMAAILTLCGELLLYSPHGDDKPAGFSERISPLAARLPSSCRVTRIRQPLPCRLSHGQSDPVV